MKQVQWVNFQTFIGEVAVLNTKVKTDSLLFRGQPCSKPLLPKIARHLPHINSTELERGMLLELRRQGSRFPEVIGKSDLDLLAIAQHHGMATRLLDWSTNPLVALWFACSEFATSESAHLSIYKGATDVILNPGAESDPFCYAVTRIFQPAHNNARVVAQSGWFSIHPFYAQLEFKALDEDVIHFLWVYHLEIPAAEKISIISYLDILGINHRSLFPDIDGLCRHISWQHSAKWPANAF